jgi:hypothetical protein
VVVFYLVCGCRCRLLWLVYGGRRGAAAIEKKEKKKKNPAI